MAVGPPDSTSWAAGELLAFSTSTGPVRITPAGLVRPRSLSDVQDLIAEARATGVPLTARGGGTGMPGGNVGTGTVVDMVPGFGSVDAPDPGSPGTGTGNGRSAGTIVAGAGAVLQEVARAASTVGLDLPPLPSSAGRCTVGGVVANNAAGARTFGHGSTRHWVEGVEAALGNGRTLSLDASPTERVRESGTEHLLSALRQRWPRLEPQWPHVTKNSSGYALPDFVATGDPAQLLLGSEGTLGLVTRTRFRLRGAPQAVAVALVSLPSADDLIAVAEHAREVGASACEFFGERFVRMAELDRHPVAGPLVQGAWGMALIEVEGEEDGVDEQLHRLVTHWQARGLPHATGTTPQEAAKLWGIRREASPTIAAKAGPGLTSVQFIEDSVVPPGRLPEYLRDLDAALDRAGVDAVVFGHAGDGNVHVNPLIDFGAPDWESTMTGILDDVASSVARLGGTLSGEHGDGRVRAPLLDRIWDAGAMDAFRLVKETLDPDGILNPGVILPVPGQRPFEGIGPKLEPVS